MALSLYPTFRIMGLSFRAPADCDDQRSFQDDLHKNVQLEHN